MPLSVFESSVNSYDSQTIAGRKGVKLWFESSVNSYDSQTRTIKNISGV